MSVFDGRTAAWAAAWQRLEAAQKLKVDRKNHIVDPLPEVYWALITEAQAYTSLATVGSGVGFSAGAWLNEEQQRQDENRRFVADAMERLKARRAEDAGGSSGCG